ncbi:DNA-directed RNA polymerase subunit alpha C-terminal domain-containing protein [Cohnella hashimotonis]|uniref:DNA-directed RNA polymerase subunit alpha C-terminal domain-containing protein n=1 Tax=Cohnella hashimotonis TaxID=2826895 RepID=A0ABT6TNA4_9BACL|nr:DNA-directed RNA polymerase subunit alpha C-terminal domain-containing protein [Cohnella hashimotonis]MDI4648333.1 DNA-directed RNA polymerase subunit alpha C-terminal domain-containing protein [Cohnella hashimotonis]
MEHERDLPERLSKPALRALASAGIQRLDQLADWRAADILKLHGMGRKGIDTLEQALAERGLSFKKAEA